MVNFEGSYCGLLRHELRLRNLAFAKSRNLAHVVSYGEQTVVIYEALPDKGRHGNFMDASYGAILKRSAWSRRLEKVHTHARRSLPQNDRGWKELDSSMSSDALLMNIFCHPRATTPSLSALLGVDSSILPEFGFRARVPLMNGRTDRTEIDLKVKSLLIESKLTEGDFQIQKAAIVEAYRDLEIVFNRKQLPRTDKGEYVSYQLIRNVLAAHELRCSFCVLLDERRPDLKDAWYEILQCVIDTDLKTRCKLLTWQELAAVLPAELQEFLDLKYGIVPPGRSASRPWEEIV
jgi:hypothetical protein